MAHNFKLTGTYYVSVDGSDSNNGLTKDTPKRTVQAGLNLMTTSNAVLIVGAGVYQETITRIWTSGPNTIKADGKVVFEGNGSNFIYLSIGGTGGATLTVEGIEFRNYIGVEVPDTSINPVFRNCIFKCNTYLTGTPTHTDCIWLNANFYNSRSTGFQRCIFINSSIAQSGVSPSGVIYANPCIYFVDSILVNSIIRITPTTINYLICNDFYNSTIIMNLVSVVTSGTIQDIYGRYYNLAIATSTGTGTVGDPYGRPYTSGAGFDYTNHKIAYPAYNAGSISADPQFNNIEAQDFTLQASSPVLGKASDSTNIGGTKYAIRHSAKGDAFNTSAVSVTSLSFYGNDYQITSPATTGEVVSAPILVSSPTPKVVQKITYQGLLSFNKLISGGTFGNINVPDAYTYTSSAQPPNVAGANPDRLVYELRYSTQASQPTADAQWDNGGYWTAGNYGVFEWNTKPSIDTSYIGNGDPTFNLAATPVYLNATWIQIKVKLRNNYA
jgi:hypothetical protein